VSEFFLDRIYRIYWIFSFGRSPAWHAIAAQSSDGGKRAPKHQSPLANKDGNYKYKFKYVDLSRDKKISKTNNYKIHSIPLKAD